MKKVINKKINNVKQKILSREYDEIKTLKKQRDVARKQRDDAREQRDNLKSRCSSNKKSKDSSGFTKSNFFINERERSSKVVEISEKPAELLTINELEILNKRKPAKLEKKYHQICPPSKDIAFLTVGNDKFIPGLEALLLSIKDIYHDIESDFYVYHDGSISEFFQHKLSEIYPNVIFVHDEMEWLELRNISSDNHKRIGKLGYMNVNALKYSQYEHVIILDSDMIIQNDISQLWTKEEGFKFCYDVGEREYSAFSQYTDDYVINSGVISIPKKYLGEEYFDEMKEVVLRSFEADCSILNRFADQKSWNIFLKDKEKTELPINYNCNIKYVRKHDNGFSDFISILHFTGPKPWFKSDYIDGQFALKDKGKSLTFHHLWESKYRVLKANHRLKLFNEYSKDRFKKISNSGIGKDLLLIGNGPSLNKVDFSRLRNKTKIAFNWFVNHEDFDDIKVDHLVIASHMFYGGWNTQIPSFPNEYLEKLRAHKHKPSLWTSFYFKPLFEKLGLDKEFDCNYLLFEKPFKNFIDHQGATELCAHSFVDDGRTGVITFGMTIGKLANFSNIYLLGCDSNYSGKAQDNYFYDSAMHTSLCTNNDNLNETWLSDSYGQYCYQVAKEALDACGINLYDATIDGSLTILPKVDILEL
ncbi:hypothetical protein JCM19240_680 [Vibrio maritimus]|uniref:Glycosyl transferase family 8 n=1 Tax=Vibrio maritimus TaxID=990268 RepID=A0A090TE11_9VIBR|nr:hypothetical protein JCM19240_680 [Vibrio maritimus]